MSKLSTIEREEGFTLIELLVVILIIGILSAIAVPAFLNQRKSAIESTMKSDLRNNVTIVTGKVSSQGYYPASTPEGIVKSEGVGITYASNGKSFCLKAIHESQVPPVYYDSVLDGLSNNSCSVKLDLAGTYFAATPGGEIIYPGYATWAANGTGPSGEVAMELKKNPSADPGWGAYGLYEMANGTIPAGSKVTISYYVKTGATGNYALQIINGNGTSAVIENLSIPGSTSWKRNTISVTTLRDWVPGVHSMRWGMGNTNPNILISDVQVDVVQ